MEKDCAPYGETLGLKVAYSDGLAIHFTQAKRLIWVAGQLPFDDEGKIVGRGDIAAQTEQCLKNMRGILQKLGGTMADVVQVTVFVKDSSNLKGIHEVRFRYFKEPYPTSTLVEIKGFVHPDALIEINAVAVV